MTTSSRKGRAARAAEDREWEAMIAQALWDSSAPAPLPRAKLLPPARAERIAAVLERFEAAFARLA